MAEISSRLICSGCGYEAPAADASPFRCPNAGDDRDHVLRRVLSADDEGVAALRLALSGGESNPFLRFRELLHSYRAGLAHGVTDADFVHLVEELDAAVAEVDGKGFRETPFFRSTGLAAALGVAGAWVKDETDNVSGSHKARHLFGLMLWLRMRDPASNGAGAASEAPLAIASCGNAALGAAVVARAAGRALEVFVPPEADRAVIERLRALGSGLTTCVRREGELGDPCYLRFREAVAAGALPFAVQGSENGLTLDGAKTLAWEMAMRLATERPVDRLFVQVGGGALATACLQGLQEAHCLGVLPGLPRFHAVQSEGAHPLERAYNRVVDRILETTGSGAAPEEAAVRARLASEAPHSLVQAVIAHAAAHRLEFMWPWEEEPRGAARGILDDETYDWLAVVEGMLLTGGYPVTVSEARILEANQLVKTTLGIAADHTGTAGLAGAIELSSRGELRPDETVAVLVTGCDRQSDGGLRSRDVGEETRG